ncbi:MAG: DUF371 domain-containing protein [Thermofilaceae archaeon]|nr:DUF371 domain-containing protein [Thermofilaceae archaeon]MCX8181087.1 DUF371 domain-containing protein [Thermofilaceae archaeon]MDW8004568.1 DUF371 domain-containing protein [Thermofilaceae archaeon]
MIVVDRVKAVGHPLIKATHTSTFEVTRESTLTVKGDCIIAVNADKGAAHLSDHFKRLAANDDTRILIFLISHELVEIIRAQGSVQMTFTDERSLVVRRSRFVDGRTVAVRSEKAAADLDRTLVRQLQLSNPLTVVLIAYTPDEGEKFDTLRSEFNLSLLERFL